MKGPLLAQGLWPSGLSTSLGTQTSKAGFLVGAYAWVADQVPSWRHARGNRLVFLCLFLPPFPLL